MGTQNEEFKRVELYLGLNNDEYKKLLKRINKGVEERSDISERLAFLRNELIKIKEKKRKVIRDKEEFCRPDEIMNNYFPLEAAIKELENKVIEMISDCNEILELEVQSKPTENYKAFKWLGTPSQLGYVFLELAKRGFIEIPLTKGDTSFSKYAQSLFEVVEFKNKTTIANFKKEVNENSNTLSNSVRNKFNFPELKDIS